MRLGIRSQSVRKPQHSIQRYQKAPSHLEMAGHPTDEKSYLLGILCALQPPSISSIVFPTKKSPLTETQEISPPPLGNIFAKLKEETLTLWLAFERADKLSGSSGQ